MNLEQTASRAGSGPSPVRISQRTRTSALGLALGLAMVGGGLAWFLGPTGGSSPASGVTRGMAAPDFKLTTFEGHSLSLADLRGKGVVLNFWASWCPPCRTEVPYFESTYRAYRERGVQFVGVAIQDKPESARAFLKELGVTYPAGLDEGSEISWRYQLAGLPTTVFITREGKVSRYWTGALSERQLVSFVKEIAR